MPILLWQTRPETAVARSSFQTVLAAWLRRLGPGAYTAIGVTTFLVALLLTLPASLALKATGFAHPNAVGTVWKGEAAIGDRTAVSWRVRPLKSLIRLALVSDVNIRGGQTELAAIGVWRPGTTTLEHLAGVAGPGLTDVLLKDLPIRCDLSFVLDLDRVVIAGKRSGAEGTLRSPPGRCAARNGFDTTPAAVPAMVGSAVMNGNGSSAWLAPSATPDRGRLVQLTIDRTGKLTATVLEAGALILPATAGRLEIETQL